MKWEKVKLGDICKYVTSGGTPKSSIKEYYEPKQIPWLKTKEVNYCRIYETESYISKDGLDNSSAKMIPQNSVIVAMYGQGDTAGRVAINKIPLTTNQACCNLIIDETKAYYEFVYYQLVTLYEKMVSLKNGGAQPNLNAAIIKSIEIKLPPLKTQRYIADILSSYDNLIENNQKQIKLLEEAAQRLYKEWFVDLRFPGYENTKTVDGVPEGWKKERLVDIAEIQYGYAFDGTLFNADKNGTPIIRIRNIPQAETMDYTTEHVSEKYLVQNGEIIVGMDGEFHINAWAGNTAYLVQRTCCIRPRNRQIKGWLLQAIYEPIKFFEHTVVGATVSHLGKKHLDSIYLLTSPEEFYEPFKTFFDKRLLLMNQNRKLREARDRLLPKLMSGKVKV